MLVMRTGAAKFRGLNHIKIKADKYEWREEVRFLTISGSDVADFSSRTHHNYIVSFDVEELKEMLGALAGAALAGPAKFEDEFGGSLKAIVTLQTVAAGVMSRK